MSETPTLFRETFNPNSAIVVPEVSGERRKYIPIGFIDDTFICTDLVKLIPDADIYLFGVLTSIIHMAWVRVVAGRLGMSYRYSNKIVYNNFPFITMTANQRSAIESTAQNILSVRAKYPEATLADLYDELAMPVDLWRAHIANDKAVMAAYGFRYGMSEAEIVNELFKMYLQLTKSK